MAKRRRNFRSELIIDEQARRTVALGDTIAAINFGIPIIRATIAAPLMPIDEWDRDRAKHGSGLLGFITAHFMWSMESQDDLRLHPSFADFAAGLLWLHDNVSGPCELLPGTSEQLSQMKRRYSPRKLEGLNHLPLALAAAAKRTKRKPASCLTGSLSIGPRRRNYARVDV